MYWDHIFKIWHEQKKVKKRFCKNQTYLNEVFRYQFMLMIHKKNSSEEENFDEVLAATK